MFVVLSALRQEISGIEKYIQLEEGSSTGAWSGRQPRILAGKFAGVPILLAQTGMGKAKAQAATETICRHYPVSALIFLGFGGALAHELKVGDLVLCRKILSGKDGEMLDVCQSNRDLINIAEQALQNVHVDYIAGNSLTVERVLTHPGEKERLGRQTGALVAEMESFWIARIAADTGTPFLAVRSISDTVSESLPPFDRFTSSEDRIRWKEVWRHFLTHPADLGAIGRLYLNSRRARESLTRFFLELIPRLKDQPLSMGNANASSDPGSVTKSRAPVPHSIRLIEGEMSTYGSTIEG